MAKVPLAWADRRAPAITIRTKKVNVLAIATVWYQLTATFAEPMRPLKGAVRYSVNRPTGVVTPR